MLYLLTPIDFYNMGQCNRLLILCGIMLVKDSLEFAWYHLLFLSTAHFDDTRR